MPIKFIYYEGDYEFPSTIRILFDTTAIEVYKFEPLAVLHHCIDKAFAAVGEAI
jgi:hypothetical protein